MNLTPKQEKALKRLAKDFPKMKSRHSGKDDEAVFKKVRMAVDHFEKTRHLNAGQVKIALGLLVDLDKATADERKEIDALCETVKKEG